MEYGFSVLMFCFSGAILLYAGLLAVAKHGLRYMLPRRYTISAKMGNPVRYARRVAKILVLCAAAPLLSGLVGLTGKTLLAGIVFVAALTGAVWLGVRITRGPAEEP